VIEGDLGETGEPKALIDEDDPRLQKGVDENGEAIISRWWSVWFFEGTREQQDARLKELRLDPRFQTPCSEDEFPVVFEGEATCEDVYLRLSQSEQNEKLISASTS